MHVDRLIEVALTGGKQGTKKVSLTTVASPWGGRRSGGGSFASQAGIGGGDVDVSSKDKPPSAETAATKELFNLIRYCSEDVGSMFRLELHPKVVPNIVE